MKPLGRKCFRPPSPCKHKVKEKGKTIEAWWENICHKGKNSEKHQCKKEIKLEIEAICND
jgi:hypothetical protein